MAKPSNEEIVRRYYETQAAHDYDSAGALRDPDWLREWPQSGERVRGSANDRAIMASPSAEQAATAERHGVIQPVMAHIEK